MDVVAFYVAQAKVFRWRARMAPDLDLKAKHCAAAARMLESAREAAMAEDAARISDNAGQSS